MIRTKNTSPAPADHAEPRADADGSILSTAARQQRRATRTAARARRRADIDQRARALADRQISETGDTHWSLHLAVALITALWLAGCLWLFKEQSRFAEQLGFEEPKVFPAIVDGGAFVGAILAYAISLSGRSGGGSRLFSIVINLMSSAANGAGAWDRSHDITATIVAATVPLVLMWLFHLILGELRLRVRIKQGLPAEKAPPALRLMRVLLAGRWAFTEWRAAGLAITDPLRDVPSSEPGPDQTDADRSDGPDRQQTERGADRPALPVADRDAPRSGWIPVRSADAPLPVRTDADRSADQRTEARTDGPDRSAIPVRADRSPVRTADRADSDQEAAADQTADGAGPVRKASADRSVVEVAAADQSEERPSVDPDPAVQAAVELVRSVAEALWVDGVTINRKNLRDKINEAPEAERIKIENGLLGKASAILRAQMPIPSPEESEVTSR